MSVGAFSFEARLQPGSRALGLVFRRNPMVSATAASKGSKLADAVPAPIPSAAIEAVAATAKRLVMMVMEVLRSFWGLKSRDARESGERTRRIQSRVTVRHAHYSDTAAL